MTFHPEPHGFIYVDPAETTTSVDGHSTAVDAEHSEGDAENVEENITEMEIEEDNNTTESCQTSPAEEDIEGVNEEESEEDSTSVVPQRQLLK